MKLERADLDGVSVLSLALGVSCWCLEVLVVNT